MFPIVPACRVLQQGLVCGPFVDANILCRAAWRESATEAESWTACARLVSFILWLYMERYMLAVPYLAAVAGVNLAGRCSDAAIMRGAQTRHVRKSVQFLATVGASAQYTS